MRKFWTFTLLAALLILTWQGYRAGASGALYYDDIPNLELLKSANTPLLLADFVLTGNAGPTGRPLSLISFALQREYWPENIAALLNTNIILHLLTGVLAWLLAYGITRALNPLSSHRLQKGIALSTAALWLFSPFLASAPLILVQRMTVLSGLFVFGGLAAYVWGRLLQEQRPRAAFGLMCGGLLAGTALATLAKENGILLVLLALSLEYTLLRKAPRLPAVNRNVSRLLVGLSAALLAYLAIKEFPVVFAQGWRDFTPWQRFISQPIILLDYVYHLLIPSTASVSPFTHWTTALPNVADPRFWVSTLAWGIALAMGWRWRTRAPAPWFALVFFLTGHLLESSFVYLELYFAHRNYVPAFALYFLIAHTALTQFQGRPRLATLGLACYATAFFSVLFLTTSLWGQPRMAAEMWAIYYPNSIRAQHHLANLYAQEGNYAKAAQLLDEIEELANRPGTYQLQPLFFCNQDDFEIKVRVQNAIERFPKAPRVSGSSDTLETLANQAMEGKCDRLTKTQIDAMIDSLLSSPAYAPHSTTHSKLWLIKARLAGEEQRFDDMLNDLDQAFRSTQNSDLDIGLFSASVLASQKQYAKAQQTLSRLETYTPANPVKRLVWEKRLAEWRNLIATDEQLSNSKLPAASP